jgi:hypothetical protein
VILLAHAGHWLVNAAYFAPVAGFLGWLGWTELRSRREKRAEARRATAEPGPAQPSGD